MGEANGTEEDCNTNDTKICEAAMTKAVEATAPEKTLPNLVEHPRLLSNGLEVSVHTCSRLMLREIYHIFPEMKAKKSCAGDAVSAPRVLMVLTIQKARMDIVRVGPDVECEKDRCLEEFVAFAKVVSRRLESRGHWVDYIDPCSGLPMLTAGCTRPWNEVSAFENLLRYKTQNAGCCKVLLHPRWGSACYPATLFTTAPVNVLREALHFAMDGIDTALPAEGHGELVDSLGKLGMGCDMTDGASRNEQCEG